MKPISRNQGSSRQRSVEAGKKWTATCRAYEGLVSITVGCPCCNSPMHKVKQCPAILSPAQSTCLMQWPREKEQRLLNHKRSLEKIYLFTLHLRCRNTMTLSTQQQRMQAVSTMATRRRRHASMLSASSSWKPRQMPFWSQLLQPPGQGIHE